MLEERASDTLLNQSASPDQPFFVAPRDETVVVDCRNRRLFTQFEWRRSGYVWSETTLVDATTDIRSTPKNAWSGACATVREAPSAATLWIVRQ